MDKTMKIIIFALAIIVGGFIAFGTNALIVLAVCKIMGWAFAWKWVVLFTVAIFVLKGIFQPKEK